MAKATETLLIRSRSSKGFRRAGIQFTPTPQEIDLAELTELQVSQLEQELDLGKYSNLVLVEDKNAKAKPADKDDSKKSGAK